MGGGRQINRLRAQLLAIFPALERAPTLTNQGPVMLPTCYQTPAAIRRTGAKRIETWLKTCKVRGVAEPARTAVEAAQSQHTALPGEKPAASLVARLANGVIALNEEIAEIDALIEARFHQHQYAKVINSLPGMGPCLGAEFIGRFHRGLLRAFYLSTSPVAPTAVRSHPLIGLAARVRHRIETEIQAGPG
ncbi:hypothetical protein GCM10010507_22970 [Streptomyces cinnamoneus]|uniref:IS110 family transposase n=1 Tax=Streptomyces cinnamoneus TaxID=53446 RepID=A0A918THG6_STRCJ|nr:hypothetical protein GCM10010507_22970 [Streptomyces cinnamoneus]